MGDKNKLENQDGGDDSDNESRGKKKRDGLKIMGTSHRYRHKAGQGKTPEKSGKFSQKAHRPELKPKEQILKARRKKAQKMNFMKHRERLRQKKGGGKKKHN